MGSNGKPRQHVASILLERMVVTEVGGLISYGNDNVNIYRRAATYADRILRGAEPSELPVQFPVKFELVINRKTADAFSLDVPASFYRRADEVIE